MPASSVPEPGFLEGLRELTRDHGALAHLDEVMNALPHRLRGAQAKFGCHPRTHQPGQGDRAVVCPWGPTAARADTWTWWLRGPMYQAGTLAAIPWR